MASTSETFVAVLVLLKESGHSSDRGQDQLLLVRSVLLNDITVIGLIVVLIYTILSIVVLVPLLLHVDTVDWRAAYSQTCNYNKTEIGFVEIFL